MSKTSVPDRTAKSGLVDLEDDKSVAVLFKNLGPEFVSMRPGPGGMTLHYLTIGNLSLVMALLFGVNGWSSSIVGRDILLVEERNNKWSATVSVTARVTLTEGGSWHEDVGTKTTEDKTKGTAIEKALKAAATDAIKRACRPFGNPTGGCLSNPAFVKRLKSVVCPPRDPCSDDNIIRMPEYKKRSAEGIAKKQATDLPPAYSVSQQQERQQSNFSSVVEKKEEFEFDEEEFSEYAFEDE